METGCVIQWARSAVILVRTSIVSPNDIDMITSRSTEFKVAFVFTCNFSDVSGFCDWNKIDKGSKGHVIHSSKSSHLSHDVIVCND